ncbi:MAG: hypothetical protein P8074_25240 [Anaerolineales bacterium]
MTEPSKQYRRQSNRLAGWDYSSSGYYFVTICTRERRPFFGEVVGDEIQLSPIGEIIAEEWQKTADIRPNISLDAWVIMPNHLHAIVSIQPSEDNDATTRWDVSQRDGTSSNAPKNWRSNSLGTIINQFKSKCTKRIRAAGHTDFGWQSRFYDHIIRNDQSLAQIRTYIQNNLSQWNLDKENPDRESP